jgi:hypothetical protein
VTKILAAVLTIVLALWQLVLGGWAFLAPESFAVTVASFAPYNRHLLHDTGAFMCGLGVVLLLGLFDRRVLVAAAAANTVAAVLHVVSHVEDAGLGGHAYDVPALTLLAALFLLLAVTGLRSKEVAR